VADLVPSVGDAGGKISCSRTNNAASLNVTVANRGSGKTGPFDVVVTFPQQGPRDTTSRSALSQRMKEQAGGSKGETARFAVPVSCFNPNCAFRVAVDPANSVAETNKGNNVVTGVCTP
jgi:hypothetical protein